LTVPEQWLEKAKYDMDTARAMLKAERYVYVIFCCQQAIEKSLKAIIADRTKEMPPRLHNLLELATIAGVDPGKDRRALMRSLTNFYIHSRYPGTPEAGGAADRRRAEDDLKKTEETLQWLSGLNKM
jgi:HEPN domain-containing protein